MASKNGRKYLKDEDFEEEEIWGVMEERENSSPKLKKTFKNSSFYSSSYATKHASPRMIPKSSSSSSSSSVVAGSSEKQSSAPLAIPDWSKIYGKASKKNKNGVSTSSWFDNNNNYNYNYNYNAVTHDGYYGNNNYNGVGHDNGHHHHDHDHEYNHTYDHEYNHTHDHANGCYGGVDRNDDDGYDDDDDDDDDMVPPHEFLARKLARSQISSFSVYEGIGRTLKGRDLSKVRNAILTKTGFLE